MGGEREERADPGRLEGPDLVEQAVELTGELLHAGDREVRGEQPARLVPDRTVDRVCEARDGDDRRDADGKARGEEGETPLGTPQLAHHVTCVEREAHGALSGWGWSEVVRLRSSTMRPSRMRS